MSVTREMLAAYADGELGPEDRALVEAAMAADPALAGEVEAHRALRSTLSAHFAPILDMPVPDRLKAALEQQPPAAVIDFAAARAAKQSGVRPRFAQRWMTGGAIAASLVIGVLIGGQLPGGEDMRGKGGRLIADGALDRALTTQLASAQEGHPPVRILLSFKADDGRYCRAFESGTTGGIACREDGQWAVVRTEAGIAGQGTAYRQAGSAAASIMAAAQDMAAEGALDTEEERAARDAHWGG